MKPLFDENLSHKLAELVASEYPGSVPMRRLGFRGADDARIWEHARVHGFAIVSKDHDVRQEGLFRGPPPRGVWLDVGSAGTSAFAELLRAARSRLEAFDLEEGTGLLSRFTGAGLI